MLNRTKLVWLIFIMAFSHKVQKCVDFSWNVVHSSEPQNRLCVITPKMLNQIQPNFRVYLISMKYMHGIRFENIWKHIFDFVSHSGNFWSFSFVEKIQRNKCASFCKFWWNRINHFKKDITQPLIPWINTRKLF